jgi:hypothetical protein
MKTLKLPICAADSWVAGDGSLAPVQSAVTGEVIVVSHGPKVRERCHKVKRQASPVAGTTRQDLLVS